MIIMEQCCLASLYSSGENYDFAGTKKRTMEKKLSEDHSVPIPIAGKIAASRIRADLTSKEENSKDFEQTKQANKVRPMCIDAVHRLG